MIALSALGWLLVPAFFLLRQVALPRRSLFTFDWYTLLLVYLSASYVFPALAILAGVALPSASYVHQHPGAAESALGSVLLLVFSLGSWGGYRGLRGAPLAPREVEPSGALLVGLIVIITAAVIAWIVGFGGFVSAITNVMMIRFGTVTSESSAPWFMGLTRAAWFSSVIALDASMRASRFRGDRRLRLLAWSLLAVSGLALLLIGSRGAIGNVLLSMILYIYARRNAAQKSHARALTKKSRMKLLAIIGAAAAVVVLFKPAMTLIAVASTDYTLAEAIANFEQDVQSGTATEEGAATITGKIASEFSHFPILSTLAFEDDQLHPEERDYGRDLVIAVGKLLPASIYEPAGTPLSFRSTELILGRWESQVPPGIVAWLLFTGGGLCLLYGSVICGGALALTERLATRLLGRTWWRESGYIAFGITIASGIVGGAPSDLVREIGAMTAVLLVASTIGALAAILPKRPPRAVAVPE